MQGTGGLQEAHLPGIRLPPQYAGEAWVSRSGRKNGEPPGTRTQGPRLKRAMLYRLSYRLE